MRNTFDQCAFICLCCQNTFSHFESLGNNKSTLGMCNQCLGRTSRVNMCLFISSPGETPERCNQERCLNPPGLLWQNTTDWVTYKQENFISHRSKGWEVQDQGTRRFCVWWEPASWFTDSHPVAVSTHGRKEQKISRVFYLRVLPFMRALPSVTRDLVTF